MKKPLVILTDPLFPEIIKRELMPHARVKIIANNRPKLLKILKDADGLITLLGCKVNDELLEAAPKLKVVGNYAVGYDNIDLKACHDHGVRVTNTPGVLTRSTAELALTLLMSAARRVPEGETMCRTGHFPKWTPDLLLGQELKGRTAVLVGAGRIGKEAARLFRGVGLNIVWIQRGDSEAQIRAKLKQAQVLSFHLPLSPESYHWLDRSRLALLPRDAIVINTARGPIINEKALIDALKRRRIFAAGLDVFEREPLISRGLLKLPNVVMLPHIGSATQRAREGMARLAIQGVLGILSGKRVRNEVKYSRRKA
jgi:glyoxylate reductase